jgi:crotonobetainyl-CoA:carnitine CoA-transferase CaiB-like acyl-CoA transferase
MEAALEELDRTGEGASVAAALLTAALEAMDSGDRWHKEKRH